MSKMNNNEVVNIGLDLGSSSIKVSYYDNKSVINDFSILNRSCSDVRNGGHDVVTVDGKSVRVGSLKGYSNSVSNKVEYRHIEHMLFMVAKEVKERLNIDSGVTLDITTCLPPDQYRVSADKYMDIIKSVNQKTAIVGGEEITMNIHDVSCGAEGIMMLNVIDINDIVEGLNVIVIDVGSGTTDFVILQYNGSSWSIKDAGTSVYAGWKMVSEIREHLIKEYPYAKFDARDLERLGRYQVNGNVHEVKDLADHADKTIESMIIDIEDVVSIREHKVILTGRGSNILSNSKRLKDITKNVYIVSDKIMEYGNSRGCLVN